MKHGNIYRIGYIDGMGNKPNRSHNYVKFSSMWKAYEAGYKQGTIKGEAA
jgi:hypothetical protein